MRREFDSVLGGTKYVVTTSVGLRVISASQTCVIRCVKAADANANPALCYPDMEELFEPYTEQMAPLVNYIAWSIYSHQM